MPKKIWAQIKKCFLPNFTNREVFMVQQKKPMTRSVRIAILLLFLLTALAALSAAYFTDERHLQRYARKIERHLQERAEDANAYAGQLDLSPALRPLPPLVQASWGMEPFNIAWYQGDSLVFTLNSRFLPPRPAEQGVSAWFLQRDSSALFIGKWVSSRQIIWLPLWKEKGGLFGTGFYNFPKIPDAVVAGVEKSDHAIRGPGGEDLAYLRATGPFRDPLEAAVLFWILVAMGLTVAFLIGRAAGWLSKKYSPWWGLLFLLVFMAGAGLALRYLFPGSAGVRIAPSVLQEPILQQSLGGLLLNAFFLVWLMLFFHREMKDLRFPALPGPAAILFSAVNYLSILLGMILIGNTIRNIVLYSDLNVYPKNLFSIDSGSVLALLALVFLFIAFFLFCHRMGRVIVAMGLRPLWRMASLGLALTVMGAFILLAKIPFPLPYFVLSAIVFVGALDLFSEAEVPNLTWLIVWLAIFAGFSALSLSGFHREKEDKVQQDLAVKLATEWNGNTAERSSPPAGPFEAMVPGSPARGGRVPAGMDYAVFNQGRRVDCSPNCQFPLEERLLPAVPEKGALAENRSAGRIEWAYRSEDGATAIVSRIPGGFIEPLSLFSYLFALFILAMPVLALLNNWLRFLPETLDFTQVRRQTLSNRIQLWVIGFLLLSFVFIGFFSVWNFRQIADFNQEVQVRNEIDDIRQDAESRVILEGFLPGFPQMFVELGRLHRTDLLVYSTGGRLEGTTLSYRFRKDLTGEHLNGVTRYLLTEGGKSIDLQTERAGAFSYQTAYFPIRGPGGEQLAIIGMPFAQQPSVWEEDLSGFISALINVYVFLLLFAGAFAIFIANSISKPISELGASLRKLKLGKNEPLVYTKQDELGDLIEEYNHTLQKLEESTRKLAQSERQSAWREMARQIAHEIKNPLTPMQLGIQNLELARSEHPEKVAGLTDRLLKTFAEQINRLNEIATSFSAFAKMPEPLNAIFPINDLVSNVHELFRNEQPGFGMDLELPEESLFLFADRNQLMQVLNNLYKNAIQAIPEGREGKISTRCYRRDGRVVVEIGDNGSGIPEEMREKVFVPNFTTKTSGSGLGLALSKNFVESAGGRLYFETEPGKGTHFFIELPQSAPPQ